MCFFVCLFSILGNCSFLTSRSFSTLSFLTTKNGAERNVIEAGFLKCLVLVVSATVRFKADSSAPFNYLELKLL